MTEKTNGNASESNHREALGAGFTVALLFVVAMAAATTTAGGDIGRFGATEWLAIGGFAIATGALLALAITLRGRWLVLSPVALSAAGITASIGTVVTYVMANGNGH